MTYRDKRPVIGLVVAIEMDAVLGRYGRPVETTRRAGVDEMAYENDVCRTIAVSSGAGEIQAAAATQHLITAHDPDMILNFGVVGSLTEQMAVASTCVVGSVIHYAYETVGWVDLPPGQYPGEDTPYVETSRELALAASRALGGAPIVVCASADRFVNSAEDKRALHDSFGADICDMESAAIARTCRKAGVQCLLIKAVSDSLVGGGREFMTELGRVSAICMEAVDKVIRELYS